MDLPIGEIISNAFRLAWRHKYLWLFGLFAGSGFGGGGRFFGDDWGGERIEAVKAYMLAALATIILIGFIVGMVVLVLHVITKSALIYNVYQIHTGGTHSLSGGWDFGVRRFWPMLGVTLLEILAFLILIGGIIIVEVMIFIVSVPLGVLSLLLALPLGIALIVLLLLTWTYAERFVALENRGVVDALAEGWALLRSQLKPSLLMLLAKIAIAIVAGVATMIVVLVIGAPAIALWLVSKPLAVVYGILLLVPVMVVINSYFGTFDSAVWTRVFLMLRAPAYAAAQKPAAPPESPSTTPPLFE